MANIKILKILDLGIHTLLVSWLIILLRKISANGLELSVMEFGLPVLISVCFMIVAAAVQTLGSNRTTKAD